MMNDYIYHHGILGQKWGIRRFQRKDGSLIKSGKVNYSSAKNKKPIKYMNNDELRRHIERLTLEKQYANLTSKKSNAAISFGEKMASKVINDVGKELVKDFVTKPLANTTKNKIMKMKEVYNAL